MLWERVRPDRIIVETSGVALPFDTQLNLWREPVSAWVEDDMAVVVVNAEQLLEGRDLEGTFEDQVSSADLLLLNKIDLIPPEALGRVEAMLHTLAPETPLLWSVQGAVDPAVLFPPDPAGVRAQRRTTRPEPSPHQHDMFHAQEISVEDGIEPEVLSERLRRLGTLRAKGFVQTSQGLRLVQGVGRRIELTEVTLLPPPALLGRVVVITKSGSPAHHAAQPAP